MVPDNFSLSQNYPNPFNPTTDIHYQLPVKAHVTLKVFNILGQEVRTLVNGTQEAGFLKVQWDGKDNLGLDVASGIYLYRFDARAVDGRSFQQIRKMSLIR